MIVGGHEKETSMDVTGVKVAVEYNEDGTMLFVVEYPGAFTRGGTREEALAKADREVSGYCAWAGVPVPAMHVVQIIQETRTGAKLSDGDSEILLDGERQPLPDDEFELLRDRVLLSAGSFMELYDALPDPDATLTPTPRETFYGHVPRTPREMLTHVNNVTSYYTWQIGIDQENVPDLIVNRRMAMRRITSLGSSCSDRVFGTDELWTVHKVMRRFLWHDRIHAKALYRGAVRRWGREAVVDPFRFAVL